jgi:hypothetical protein
MKEKWILIENFENYAISNFGRVKNVKNEKILKQYKNSYGYMQLQLSKNGKVRTFRVHKLVAMGFIENTYGKPYINHIDGNKTNNIVYNLEWCTSKENDNHARNMKLKDQNKPCVIIDIESGDKIFFESTSECSRFLNSNNGSINRVLNGNRNKHKGYYIKYL